MVTRLLHFSADPLCLAIHAQVSVGQQAEATMAAAAAVEQQPLWQLRAKLNFKPSCGRRAAIELLWLTSQPIGVSSKVRKTPLPHL